MNLNLALPLVKRLFYTMATYCSVAVLSFEKKKTILETIVKDPALKLLQKQ
jgi:hypothetical protein